jgi:Glycosyl hydrolases family 28/MBG domain (YGX type)/Putative Ig domain/Immunoglobulin domain
MPLPLSVSLRAPLWRVFTGLLVFVLGALSAAHAATAPAPAVIPATVFDVTTYGALANGTTDNTAAIQATISAASAAGGGIVRFPAAALPYLCGPITLANYIDLRVETGATLRVLPYGTYQSAIYTAATGSYANCITINNAHDVALSGGGTIFGDGSAWWTAYTANGALPHRPYMVKFTGCTRVHVSGLTFTDSPSFHVAFSTTNDVTIEDITIRALASNALNTDGLDPAGQRYLIQRCDISVGDDNIAVKPGGTFCSDFVIKNCVFGKGHGLSVGGQSNKGLDGMTVSDCTFTGTTSALRLKADATQGGLVQNILYERLTMTNCTYPIVFYSYYNQVGSPGATSGSSQTTTTKVATYNATPPNPLNVTTLPAWKNIVLRDITSTGSTGYSIIWGLPLADYFIANVTLDNVSITGGKGLEIYDATNVQITGTTSLGAYTTYNSLAITKQPTLSAAATLGGSTTISITTAGKSGVNNTSPTIQWNLNGSPIANGTRPDGTVVSGATTATLALSNLQAGSTGQYTAVVSNSLDIYNTTTSALVASGAPVSATSSPVVVGVNTPPVLAAIPAQSVNENAALTFTASATDSDLPANTLTYSLVGAPTGAAIASSTGVFTWTPTEAQGPGTFNFTVRVSDGAANADQPVTVTVAELNTPPVLAAIPATTVNVGSTLGLTASATDSDLPANTLAYSLVGAPTGATINASTGLLSWTPTSGQGPATYNFTVRVSDGTATADQPVAVTVTADTTTTTVTSTVADEKFADGEHVTLTPPASLLWTDSQGADTVTDSAVVSGQGALVITTASTSSSQITGYFTLAGQPVTLAVGEKLVVKLRMAFTGLNSASTSSEIRGGVFDSLGNRTTSDGDTGYAFFLKFTTSGGPTNPFALYRRSTTNVANLFSAAANFTLIGTSGGGTYQNLLSGPANPTDYTLSYTIERTAATTTALTLGLTGGTIPAGYSNTVTESNTPATTFDYFAFRIPQTAFAAAVSVKQLTVDYFPLAPTISTQPSPTTVTANAGANVTLTAAASGANIVYRWTKNNTPIDTAAHPSAATATLVLTTVQAADAGAYRLTAANITGTATSNAVTLTVNTVAAPVISSAPNASGTYGHVFTLYTITASGTPTSYSATGLPTGLTLNTANGQITGTPTTTGDFVVTLGATNTGGTGQATLALAIARASLLVTADATSRPFGAANPDFTATVTGFLLGDTASAVTGAPAFVTSANLSSLPGDYALTVSAGSLAAARYTFTFAPGTLTVTPLTYADWRDQVFTVSDAANPAISDPSAKPGASGTANLLAYAFATSPLNPDPTHFPAIGLETVSTQSHLTLTFTRSQVTSDLGYVLETSADLATWSTVAGVTETLQNNSASAVVTLHDPVALDTAPRRFLRLRVTLDAGAP